MSAWKQWNERNYFTNVTFIIHISTCFTFTNKLCLILIIFVIVHTIHEINLCASALHVCTGFIFIMCNVIIALYILRCLCYITHLKKTLSFDFSSFTLSVLLHAFTILDLDIIIIIIMSCSPYIVQNALTQYTHLHLYTFYIAFTTLTIMQGVIINKI